jgi:hypothetical protein
MVKNHSYFFTIHKASQATKTSLVSWCKQQKLLWYGVVLEPYTNKPGHHVHLSFRVVNPRSALALRTGLIKLLHIEKEDLFMEPVKGKFKDVVNYFTNPYAAEHKDDPKVVDPEPAIWPENFIEESLDKKSTKTQVIEDIKNGASIGWLWKEYTEYMFTNVAKVKVAYEEIHKHFTVPIQRLDGKPQDANDLDARSALLTRAGRSPERRSGEAQPRTAFERMFHDIQKLQEV